MAEDEFSAGLPGHEEKSQLRQVLEQIDAFKHGEFDDKLTKPEQEEAVWVLKTKGLFLIARLLELSPPPWLRPLSREARLLKEIGHGILDTLSGHPPEPFKRADGPLLPL
jgi:hypothetical protein